MPKKKSQAVKQERVEAHFPLRADRYTYAQISQMTGIAEATLAAYVSRGQVHVERAGHSVFFHPASFLDYKGASWSQTIFKVNPVAWLAANACKAVPVKAWTSILAALAVWESETGGAEWGGEVTDWCVAVNNLIRRLRAFEDVGDEADALFVSTPDVLKRVVLAARG